MPPGHPAAAACLTSGGTPPAPSLLIEPSGVPDPLLGQQWHLETRTFEPGGANVLTAWATVRGSSSIIGIVDDGLQLAHPDLAPNYRAALSRDFNDNDGDPTPAATDAHGTATAGLAAARGENGIGVSGTSPRAGLAGLRLLGAATSDAQVAEALGYLPNIIPIMSNSWGPADDRRTISGPGVLARAAMDAAVRDGRDGKGRVFVWAAGNGGIGDDCNFDGYANNRRVIAVGAAADTGTASSYSEPCSALMVVAPSNGGSRGLVTTDLAGAAGYDSGSDYTTTFGGTSGAAPIVAGVVGLMLDRNPALTWRDVQAILRRTSARLQPGESDWTAGPFPHHHRFGFGLVDAAAAVSAAATWTLLPAEQMLPAVTVPMLVTIPDANETGVQDTIFVTPANPGFVVEHVEVVLSVVHPWRGDLEVYLTSPAGVVSRVAARRANDSNDNYSAWSFGSIRHWGESAAGPWTLRIADRGAADIGTWQNWTLRIYGRVGGAGQ